MLCALRSAKNVKLSAASTPLITPVAKIAQKLAGNAQLCVVKCQDRYKENE
jgi:hypothetical protein